ncbi:MAG TPA: helix-turn-helix domain-containing protein [Niabella sp.]|nr:helix-turn-helix domain-containing protein [Niabella sp.]
MERNFRFSLKVKKAAVLSVISGRQTCISAAQKIGCHRSSVQNWVVFYRKHGMKGLNLPSRTYSGEFKVEVIDYMLKNRLSLIRTAVHFGIANSTIVKEWRKLYDSKGFVGLHQQFSERKTTTMAKKKKGIKKDEPDLDQSAQKLAELQKEVEYLRAENAFLKKLDALIQEEEAAKAQSKRPKSSRN